MNREQVIQKIIDVTKAKRYLEIGVYQGTTFQKIRCRRKVAVDPDFHISLRSKARFILRNLGSVYYKMTSDDFFAHYRNRQKFGVVFIDGLHNYRQSFIDVGKALDVLNEGGVIIMHDCNPPTAAAAVPANSWYEADAMNLPGWTREWNGDVWKTIARLRSTRNDLNVIVLDCDYGLGLITRGLSEKTLGLTPNQVDNLTYADLVSHRQEWLNLKPVSYLEQFLDSLAI